MKKVYSILTVVMLFFTCSTTSAQFLNTTSTRTATSYGVENSFNTLEFSYNPVSFRTVTEDGRSCWNLNALSLAWNHAKLLPTNAPLYAQFGLGLQYSWYNDDDNDSKTTFFTARIPVNLMYYIEVPNTNSVLMPYAGLHAHLHLSGKEKYDNDSYSFFSEDDMGDSKFNRFTLGWHLGAKLALGKLVVGLAYEGPVTHLYNEDDIKYNTTQVNISLGFRF